MKEELIWICGIIPENITKQIRSICLKENEDLHLSERFFRFPLHISMKRTFYCDQFEYAKKDLKLLLSQYKTIDCGHTRLMKNRDMLWLCLNEDEKLKKIHNDIDTLLYEKYSVIIDTFDRNYLPHITIFHKGDPQNLEKMHKRLEISLPSYPITIERYAIGSKKYGNEFFGV